eukprot:101014-Pleurochrysis_carterae.AAC.8
MRKFIRKQQHNSFHAFEQKSRKHRMKPYCRRRAVTVSRADTGSVETGPGVSVGVSRSRWCWCRGRCVRKRRNG